MALEKRFRLTADRRKNIKGFTFVGLMVMTAIVGFFAMAAHPLWQNIVRRAKEQELIFRGIQYADAIARFKRENARAPLTLEELYEKKCIRKLYPDPMTEEGKWDIIYSFSGRGKRRGAGGTESYAFESDLQEEDENSGFGSGFGGGFSDNEKDGGDDSGSGKDPFGSGDGKKEDSMFGGGAGGPQQGKGPRGGIGAIVGVRTTLDEESLCTWDGKTTYNEWLFVAGKVRDQNAGFGLASNVILPGRQPVPGAGQEQGGASGGPPVSSFQSDSPSGGGLGADVQESQDSGFGFETEEQSPPPSGGDQPKGGGRPGGGTKGDDSRKGETF